MPAPIRYTDAKHKQLREYHKLWRDKLILRLYGITRPRRGLCQICGSLIEGSRLHLDHDHRSMKFRGWLCFRCNQFLGFYEAYRDQIKEYLHE